MIFIKFYYDFNIFISFNLIVIKFIKCSMKIYWFSVEIVKYYFYSMILFTHQLNFNGKNTSIIQWWPKIGLHLINHKKYRNFTNVCNWIEVFVKHLVTLLLLSCLFKIITKKRSFEFFALFLKCSVEMQLHEWIDLWWDIFTMHRDKKKSRRILF